MRTAIQDSKTVYSMVVKTNTGRYGVVSCARPHMFHGETAVYVFMNDTRRTKTIRTRHLTKV
jgi:hypothetical protein